jgi:hypothetical protein
MQLTQALIFQLFENTVTSVKRLPTARRFLIGFVNLVHRLQFANTFVKSIYKSQLTIKATVDLRQRCL